MGARGDGPALGRRGRGQRRENQGKGWGPGRQVGVGEDGSELNGGRDLRHRLVRMGQNLMGAGI